VDTAAISYRVADFLKKYPPFHSIQEDDLLKLARTGRVKFFEPNQYVLAQGASRHQVLVIQQGTVSLWDERRREAQLLDVRGAGDLLGVDQFNETRSYPYTARSESDVLVYAFPFDEFDALVQKYPDAEQFVSAYAGGPSDFGSGQHQDERHSTPLIQFAQTQFLSCDTQTTIQEAARRMVKASADSIVVLDSEERPLGVATMTSFLKWIAEGGDCRQAIKVLVEGPPVRISPEATVADAVLAFDGLEGGPLIITSDGTLTGRFDAVVTPRNLDRVFGNRPLDLLQEIKRARGVQSLRELNQRARSFILEYLTSASASDWLCGFAMSVDTNIVKRLVALTVPEGARVSWCFFGHSGRAEALTMAAPQIALIVDDSEDAARFIEIYDRVQQMLAEIGYLAGGGPPVETEFYVASAAEWGTRYAGWISDPILKEIYRARPLFDLRPIFGGQSLWAKLEALVMAAMNREFLHVVANDCLAMLPPLTFFHDAVLDETGVETAVFRLEESALRPLVDVGRVFGMASKKVFGTSTLERFAVSRSVLPQQGPIFEEASEALRTVLWQQGRAGISHNTPGTELPPSQLRSYDRQMLRRSFRSISRLIEFTAELDWLKSL